MKDLIKKILREEVQRRFVKSNQNIERTIVRVMDDLISESTRILIPPDENYGNYEEQWCRGGKVVLEARYYFNSEDEDETEEKFFAGDLYVNKNEIDFLSKILQIRKAYILNVITEWYDENYTTKFGQETGHPELEIDETHETDSVHKCYQMIDVDNISREDMIDYLDKETLSRRNQLEELPDNELKSKYRSVYNSRLNGIGNR
jgi:hypothetical protein